MIITIIRDFVGLSVATEDTQKLTKKRAAYNQAMKVLDDVTTASFENARLHEQASDRIIAAMKGRN